MSILLHSTPAPIPKTKDIRVIATFYAGILVIMAVAQLFTFEEFLVLVEEYRLPGGELLSHFLAVSIIIAEVFALPFLLRMRLSPIVRWVSMICSWLVSLVWVKIAIWLVVQESGVGSVGFLGTVVAMMPGWWAICMGCLFGILAVWVSWGMWPSRKAMKRVLKHQK